MKGRELRSGRWWPALLTVTVLLFSTVVAGASSAPTAAPTALLEIGGTAGADDAYLDVGAEYTADSPPTGPSSGDLPLCRTSAQNFYNRLRSNGYNGSRSFIYGDSLAWQSDWSTNDDSYVDNVDIAYYCDHGFSGGVSFPWDHPSTSLVPSQCYRRWGTKDVEWIAFGTCLSLTNHRGWANCMNGVHLILGYITVSYDADEGGQWANQLLAGKTFTQAWFTMCDITQPSSVKARVIAEDSRHFNDKLHTKGGPAYGDVVDNYYTYQDHNCFKPAPFAVDTAVLTTLPAYQVAQRNVDAAYAASLATTLGLSGTPTHENGQWTLTDTSGGMTRTLQVADASGGYVYQNNSALWVPPDPGAPLTLPGPEEARQLAGAFFLTHAQALPGAQYRDLTSETIIRETVATTGKEAGLLGAENVVAEEGVDVMVAYGRRLSTGLQIAGAADVAVAGPGASTKLYLGGSSGATAAANGQPIGLQGGSRDVQAVPGKTIPIQSANKAWNDFIADHGLALVTVPLDADEIVRKPVSDTLAFYEQPQGISQAELIPVWVFYADFKQGGQTLASDVIVYVPASPDYYPPEVTITKPASGATIQSCQAATFTAQATGGFGPFSYAWQSGQQAMGESASISTILQPGARPGQAGTTQQTVSVKVTNLNGQARTVSVAVNVQPCIYLPLLKKAQ